MHTPVYLDYASTTPVDPRVAEKMSACLTAEGNYANPASRSHMLGWQAEAAVETARQQVAELIHCDPREIVWTSGATEADNLAIKGIAHAHREQGQHIVTSRIEHKAVLDSCQRLEEEGYEVTYLSPNASGCIRPEQVEAALRPDTILVTLMHVNNELGVINDIASIAAITRARGIIFHVDAAQSIGKLPIDLEQLPVDLMSLTAHKIYGPKGIGALYVRRQPPLRLEPQMHGGGHERGMRSGTLPTHQIVGMGEAFRIAGQEMEADRAHITGLRDRLLTGLQRMPAVQLNGDLEQRWPGILNVSFRFVDGESLQVALRDLALSSGSACTSASLEPSYVLRAIGLSDELAHSSLRISLGRFTTAEEVDFALSQIETAVSRLRQESPHWARYQQDDTAA